ncbi:hypothetical protein LR48_Vigan04g245200 [Vigna angularis]|uniref:Uncharacterized protein n=1 Tax=Phaseolus angularis TaxID=3914 RepID=A0A0L9UI66_PHAAN|nr:hypothetical protein LR48_Vigan04g245200 [Vigna angularis]
MERKNSMELEGELDLTLSLKCGGSEETTTTPFVFLGSKETTTTPFVFLGSKETTSFLVQGDSSQTNLPSMQRDIPNLDLSLNLNPNPNPSLASFSDGNSNYLSLASCNHNAAENVSKVFSLPKNLFLLKMLFSDPNFNRSWPSFSDHNNTRLSLASCNHDADPPNAPAN